MFSSATNFNQNIDNWDISSLQDMQCMFTGVYAMKKAINRPKWKISHVNNTQRIFDDYRESEIISNRAFMLNHAYQI